MWRVSFELILIDTSVRYSVTITGYAPNETHIHHPNTTRLKKKSSQSTHSKLLAKSTEMSRRGMLLTWLNLLPLSSTIKEPGMPLVLGSVFRPHYVAPVVLLFPYASFLRDKESGLRDEICDVHRHLVNLSWVVHWVMLAACQMENVGVLERTLNVSKDTDVLCSHKVDGNTLATKSTTATNSVDIVLSVAW